jgi:hypothetical protein
LVVALKDGEAKPAESITVTWIVFEVVEVVASVLTAADAVRVASGALLAVARALLVAVEVLVVALVDVLETLVRLTTLPLAVAFQYAPATWLMAAASAVAIDSGVLVLPHVAEAVTPLVVTCAVPLS